VGKTKAMELLMTADMIGAHEALQLGLVNCVVPPGEEVVKAKELIEKIALKAPFAISRIIKTVNAFFAVETDGFIEEVNAFGECCATQDFREGAAAFVEKRKAIFQGK
jgi:enoyl-CoA hydratase